MLRSDGVIVSSTHLLPKILFIQEHKENMHIKGPSSPQVKIPVLPATHVPLKTVKYAPLINNMDNNFRKNISYNGFKYCHSLCCQDILFLNASQDERKRCWWECCAPQDTQLKVKPLTNRIFIFNQAFSVCAHVSERPVKSCWNQLDVFVL